MSFVSPKVGENPVEIAKMVQSKYNSPNKKYVVIIDYSKSIDTERLYVVDMEKSQVILKSKVSHAGRSGGDVPTDFSNEFNTKKSSLGTYLTKGTYYGGFGYSLRLSGLDPTNSNAEDRAIIFHSNKLMKSKWSWGCFATDEITNRKIINLIKGGCLVHVYK
jgi:hypothetical protein